MSTERGKLLYIVNSFITFTRFYPNPEIPQTLIIGTCMCNGSIPSDNNPNPNPETATDFDAKKLEKYDNVASNPSRNETRVRVRVVARGDRPVAHICTNN